MGTYQGVMHKRWEGKQGRTVDAAAVCYPRPCPRPQVRVLLDRVIQSKLAEFKKQNATEFENKKVRGPRPGAWAHGSDQ